METMVDKIYGDILNRIITLQLKPGEKISESKVGEIYNVSRTVVRSSIKILEEQGFLKVIPKSGTYVSKIDFDYIKATVILRIGVEKELLGRAIRNKAAKNDLVNQLENCFHMQRKFIQEENKRLFDKYDVAFHEAIFHSYNDYNMKEMIKIPILHFKRWRNLTLKSGYSLEQILKEHEELINAIICEDEQRMEWVIDAHLDKTLYSECQIKDKYKDYFK